MATEFTEKDLTASSFAIYNISDAAEWVSITPATGVQFDHIDGGVILVKNDNVATKLLKVTVPDPASSGFDAIGVSAGTKDYTVPANGKICAIANMKAYKDSSTQKVILDSDSSDVSVLILKPVSPEAATAAS